MLKKEEKRYNLGKNTVEWRLFWDHIWGELHFCVVAKIGSILKSDCQIKLSLSKSVIHTVNGED